MKTLQFNCFLPLCSEFLEIHKELAYTVYMQIINNDTTSNSNDERIFQTSIPMGGRLLNKPNKETVKEMHLNYGLDYLKSLEVRHCAYIEDKTDIFGKPDINPLGIKQDATKIIITQGFNIYDAIITNHKDKITELNQLHRIIDNEVSAEIQSKKVELFLLFTMSLLVIISLATLQNTLCRL